ncbi:glycerophosphodiester phosphodiesterase family protein [Chthonobacter albigriseus]|uniref:glycerophosphodiester phosphodiesterase family protein n=1 Tax=Chthonobacter albigriseus TaxID=1683161 RepID=UPI0015EFC5D7|nr:glycerophosphodiester phosphodiesterase family protein [Chthonobacter albigriseus]
MPALDWLTARPIAHRGYHDAAAGRVENTLGAVRAAVARGFAVEIDVHLSADGIVYVFHDDTLDRLTERTGSVTGMTFAELQAVPFKATADRIPSLAEVLEVMAGRTTLVVEVKSHFDGDHKALVRGVADVLKDYAGPVAVMSFDPRIVADFRAEAPDLVRGIVADNAAGPKDYPGLSEEDRRMLADLGHVEWTAPHFVSYWVKLLPNEVARRVREDWKLPMITWTVRTPEDRALTERYADQMTFEGFDPEA